MDHRSGSMKIISSQLLLPQLVVTVYGHVMEGPSVDKLRLETSGITYGSVETLDHTNVEILKKVKCRCNWRSPPVIM
jgi:hypothetical protein